VAHPRVPGIPKVFGIRAGMADGGRMESELERISALTPNMANGSVPVGLRWRNRMCMPMDFDQPWHPGRRQSRD